jgi:hypothetical protein
MPAETFIRVAASIKGASLEAVIPVLFEYDKRIQMLFNKVARATGTPEEPLTVPSLKRGTNEVVVVNYIAGKVDRLNTKMDAIDTLIGVYKVQVDGSAE